MKTAVTSRGKNLDSMVDPRFGRCGWFIIVDTKTGQYQAVSNELNSDLSQGAGIQAAENVARLGVKLVITGHCGPKAFRVLRSAGIRVYSGCEGTVSDVLERLKEGDLRETDTADVEGHWA
ncbi:MAG: NifB/NifX family molybdenum-iron cluster-binding protein [Bacillota bacterium]